MSDENATFLNPEAQIGGEINPEVQISGDMNPEAEITADLEGVIEVSHTYTGVENENIIVSVDNTNYTIEATLIPFDWLHYETSDWVQVSNYYTLTIPYATHKCLNAYVEEMMIKVDDDYENVLRPTYKRLANDNILIRSDSPVEFKILIKGER